jgi:hypothetical protein
MERLGRPGRGQGSRARQQKKGREVGIMVAGRFGRYELKYFVSPREIDRVRVMITPFMEPDPYTRNCPNGHYTVRSIYLDTSALRFYYEKEAGTAIRKKLRIRTYNRYCRDAVAFFEIKRKYGVTIFKERVGMSFEQAARLLSIHPGRRLDPEPLRGLTLSNAARATLERFCFLEASLQLRPTVLIVYEREAWIGRDQRRARVTFDLQVRSAYRPTYDDFFLEQGLRRLTNRKQILEIKFDGAMPPWMRPVTSYLGRSNGPISKYCHGIDLWDPADASISTLAVHS